VQELVAEGKYKECEQGWARADLDDEEVDAAEKATAYYRCVATTAHEAFALPVFCCCV
jgi:hypothetical protein